MNKSDKTVIGSEIRFEDPKIFNVIPAGTRLQRCQITTRVPSRALCLLGTTIEDCSFTAKTRLKQFSWLDTQVTGTCFSGYFEENEFGCLEGSHYPGLLHNCDFRNATLDACLFYQCEIETLNLPLWPHFSLLDPHRNSELMIKNTANPELENYCEGLTLLHDNVTAVVEYAPSLLKDLNIPEGELKSFLKECGNIRC